MRWVHKVEHLTPHTSWKQGHNLENKWVPKSTKGLPSGTLNASVLLTPPLYGAEIATTGWKWGAGGLASPITQDRNQD